MAMVDQVNLSISLALSLSNYSKYCYYYSIILQYLWMDRWRDDGWMTAGLIDKTDEGMD